MLEPEASGERASRFHGEQYSEHKAKSASEWEIPDQCKKYI